MPRRKQLEVTREDPDGMNSMDDGEDGNVQVQDLHSVPTSEVLVERAREFIHLNRDINELNSQLKLIRKSVKAAEQSLFNGMMLTKTEQLKVDGVTIYRTKNLKISSE
jgi:hypothetical protein